MRGARWGWWGCVLSLAIAACGGRLTTIGDDGGLDATAPQGTQGGPCFPNGTCTAGLTCTVQNGAGVCSPMDAQASDVGPGPDDAPPEAGCKNLQCQQTCASTGISGKVYDPAGVLPLYNVFVYVPNDALAPIADGPSATACQAPASGSPLVSTTTAPDGSFKLTNAPNGANIPLVLQLGKWRRHLTIANVATCVDNPQPDMSLRLPKKQHETSQDDNIPLIALTTGCDAAECFFLQRLGIDPSEFSDSGGTGRIRVYKSSNDSGQTFPSPYNTSTAQNATYLWNTSNEMMKYDFVVDACECSTYTRGQNGYANMLAYLGAGGRAFASHYFYNFFASSTQCTGDATCQGQGPLPTVGAWEGNQSLPYATSSCPKASQMSSPGSCLQIDTQIPRGKAFADWYAANNPLLTNGGGEAYGYCGLADIRTDMGKLGASLLAAGTATPWVYAGDVTNNYDGYYFTFNAPVGTSPAGQFGRAAFADVHFSEPPSGAFPSYCPGSLNGSPHAPDELALEFLFFDLASCIQDDRQDPLTPPPN